MKTSYLKRSKVWNSGGSTDHQKAIRNLDDALSKMVRERDGDTCILWEWKQCKPDRMECGHFIERGRMGTRFHPMNCNAESHGCNDSHSSGYSKDKGFEYGMAIDKKYGAGTAEFLYKLSRPTHQWTTHELETLKHAARGGEKLYNATYFMLRPTHKPTK